MLSYLLNQFCLKLLNTLLYLLTHFVPQLEQLRILDHQSRVNRLHNIVPQSYHQCLLS